MITLHINYETVPQLAELLRNNGYKVTVRVPTLRHGKMRVLIEEILDNPIPKAPKQPR